MNRRERRRDMRKKIGGHKAICVVCSKPIPRGHVAMWVPDKMTGSLYGAHMACGAAPKAMMAGLKTAMTTPEWFRFRIRQFIHGRKRVLSKWAARWTSSPKAVG